MFWDFSGFSNKEEEGEEVAVGRKGGSFLGVCLRLELEWNFKVCVRRLGSKLHIGCVLCLFLENVHVCMLVLLMPCVVMGVSSVCKWLCSEK